MYHGGRWLHEKSDVVISSICTVHTPFAWICEKLCAGNAHGAGDGNRTRVTCLEGRCSTIELHRQIERTRGKWAALPAPAAFILRRVTREGLVGLSGIEPASSDYEPAALAY